MCRGLIVWTASITDISLGKEVWEFKDDIPTTNPAFDYLEHGAIHSTQSRDNFERKRLGTFSLVLCTQVQVISY